MFRLNLLAAVGYYGRDVANTADYLLKEGLYNFVGSDIHHKFHVESFQRKVTFGMKNTLEELIAKNQYFK